MLDSCMFRIITSVNQYTSALPTLSYRIAPEDLKALLEVDILRPAGGTHTVGLL
jgi:hypothetical protein